MFKYSSIIIKLIISALIFIFSILFLKVSLAQTVVIRGGAIVVEKETFLVIKGDLIARNEISSGSINLNGTILLDKNIVNESQNGIFIMQEPIPNGWLIMKNTLSAQQIMGTKPINFENLFLKGSEKILSNTNSSINGILRLNSIFNLNNRTFILNNNESNSLEYLSGYIFAETFPNDGLGIFQWNIGNKISPYTIPFGSGNNVNSDLNIAFQSTSSGSSEGVMMFSTYPTDCENIPFPESTINLNPYSNLKTADRYWIIDADSYTQKPNCNIALSFLNFELEGLNTIDKNFLKPICYNQISSSWNDYPIYRCDLPNKSMLISNVISSSYEKYWTLTSEKLDYNVYFPNGFTPNGDEINDAFMPIMAFSPKEYVMYIYNRWGELLFKSNNYLKGWDGKYKNEICMIGSYCWKVIITSNDGEKHQYIGHVSLIK